MLQNGGKLRPALMLGGGGGGAWKNSDVGWACLT